MWVFLLSLTNVILLLSVSYKCVKRRIDTALLYYCAISLYFINIPLLFDSLMVGLNGMNAWDATLADVNKYWTSGALRNIELVALNSLIFNIVFLASYYWVCKGQIKTGKMTYRPLNNNTLSSLSWGTCFLFVIMGLIIFMVYNNITSFSNMEVGEWYENRSNDRVLGLLASLLVPLMSVGVIRTMYSKNYVLGLILLSPVLIIGISTGARSQIIPIVFYVMFYLLWANTKGFRLKNILVIGIIGYVLVYLLTITRESFTAVYPLYKDWSYLDLFYVYEMGSSISTHGLNTLTMLLRDFLPLQVEDITTVVADSKFGAGWGTLHPSLLGWAYVDLQNYYWVLAALFGVIIGFYDRLRHRMPMLIYLLFLSYEFAFLAIAVRGSVKFAYSQLFYPMLILIALYLIDRVKLINCHYNEYSSNKQGSVGKHSTVN